MTFQSCCFCCSLRTACIIIGAFGIFCDLVSVTSVRWNYASFVNFTSNVLLITGAAIGNRYLLLPSMIIHVLGNIALWILASLAIFAPSFGVFMLSVHLRGVALQENEFESDLRSAKTNLAIVFTAIAIFFVLVAVVHLLITKVIFDHFTVLRKEEEQREQLPTCVSSIAWQPTALASVYSKDAKPLAPIKPATIYPTDFIVDHN